MTKTYEEVLTEWQELSAQISDLTKKEAKMRQSLFDLAFPAPTEGVNKLELSDGRVVKGTFKLNRTLDQAQVEKVKAELSALNSPLGALVDDVLRTEYKLGVASYKKLSPQAKVIVDRAVTTKPGLPGLEIV